MGRGVEVDMAVRVVNEDIRLGVNAYNIRHTVDTWVESTHGFNTGVGSVLRSPGGAF